ncbi:MAG: isocitrate/isopropylmalate dehydrogenase family protein [Candidatus Caldatribacteriota bacterium]|nr:isocitrate/isopropylmalate dehydrogenase family protein [Candidatus Caldatribacteriota bacterium]
MYNIALIPGDGIGPEIIGEGKKVIEAVSDKYGLKINWTEYPFGSENYLKTGELLPDSALKEIEDMDVIYFGAIGDPRVKPGILEKGILLKIRFYFDQYINLRPIKLYKGVNCPLKDKTTEDINFYVVRENTEDFYIGIGGRFKTRTNRDHLEILRKLYKAKIQIDFDLEQEEEMAYQIGLISRPGTQRVIKYAFDLAEKKGMKRVTSVDKANVLTDIYGLWREVFEEVSGQYPNIETEFNFVDAITMYFVQKPEWFKVVVTPNMFGDIITDLGAMIQGGLGIAVGGNINPEGISMFEPIHGSAPDIAGKNISNPVATILSGAMMLDHLGEIKAAQAIEDAVEKVLSEGKVRSYDFGGNSSTIEVGDEVVRKLKEVNIK